MKNYIEFLSEYEDDIEWTQDGDIKIPGGGNIIKAYSESILGQCDEIEGIKQHSFYGWGIKIRINGVWIWQMIQETKPWLMIAEAKSLRIPFLTAGKIDDALIQGIDQFKLFLQNDPKLKYVAEYTKAEYELRK